MEAKIISYLPKHENGYKAMLQEILVEYDLLEAHKNLVPKLPDHSWIALDNEIVVGSVGLLIRKDYAVLKRMFLLADYRGKEKDISARLLNTALDWCKRNIISTIYLGTIDVFKAAMTFYEKNGFVRITEKDLPNDFPHNPIDKVFYKLKI